MGAADSQERGAQPDDGRGLLRQCEQQDGDPCGVSVAASAMDPPGPIPNPVVTHGSAGEYCGGDSVGGEAVAGTPDGGSSCCWDC